MRPIKFRAKHKKSGEWVYGDLLTNHPFHGIAILESGCINYAVDPETVGQYTDFADINGKPVYEGDVLAVYHKSEHKGLKPMEVNDTVTYEWGTPFLRTRNAPMYQFYHEMDGSFEVIGNVFDNPKL